MSWAEAAQVALTVSKKQEPQQNNNVPQVSFQPPQLLRAKTSLHFSSQESSVTSRAVVCKACEDSLREVALVFKDGESEEHKQLLNR